MTIDRMIFAMAGVMILLSVLLAVYHHINWLWLTGFVGLNLLQSAFTGFCPAALIFKKMGIQAGCAFK
ncbi:DUF2892 domain-containing protein [uncultured Thiothrix sp.]|jgi:hypothetical protein|uniref:YgaP family membrane protein n=1 Tax=uncultured Thiothrix sp. TaxID=223185 RepID=UPI00262C5AD9|nr:DUF2892 domain-containing protein [uncultured Thiothrix sp.]HMT91744.1 DUF2892 domain-containing protein [Thiolinea sp.]